MPKVSERACRRGYETQDANIRHVLLAGVIIAVALALSLGAVAVQLFIYHQREPAQPVTLLERLPLVPPVPHPDAAPQLTGAFVNGEARQRLGRFGWVAQEAGIAHIPIEDAMQRLARHGWPLPGEMPDE